ncbi:MAG: hypothetical protein M0T82_00330 [Desulfobacteraceae bacterium]|nr:hypothetical protein [Desulfobacteraceae bacterium]
MPSYIKIEIFQHFLSFYKINLYILEKNGDKQYSGMEEAVLAGKDGQFNFKFNKEGILKKPGQGEKKTPLAWYG